jgi:hypothetical protein
MMKIEDRNGRTVLVDDQGVEVSVGDPVLVGDLMYSFWQVARGFTVLFSELDDDLEGPPLYAEPEAIKGRATAINDNRPLPTDTLGLARQLERKLLRIAGYAQFIAVGMGDQGVDLVDLIQREALAGAKQLESFMAHQRLQCSGEPLAR